MPLPPGAPPGLVTAPVTVAGGRFPGVQRMNAASPRATAAIDRTESICPPANTIRAPSSHERDGAMFINPCATDEFGEVPAVRRSATETPVARVAQEGKNSRKLLKLRRRKIRYNRYRRYSRKMLRLIADPGDWLNLGRGQPGRGSILPAQEGGGMAAMAILAAESVNSGNQGGPADVTTRHARC